MKSDLIKIALTEWKDTNATRYKLYGSGRTDSRTGL